MNDGLRYALQRWSNDDLRDTPVRFVGRKTELATLLNMMETLEREGAVAGATVLFQGAPGAGKTSLLEQASRIAGEQGLLAVNVGLNPKVPELLDTLERLAVGEESPPDEIHISAAGGIGVPGVEVAGQRRTVRFNTPPANYEDLSKRVQSACIRLDRPPAGIVLLCDEAQHLPEKDRELSDLFAGVHNNRGKGAPPIMQVFAGLEDSKHVLDTLGLSRINKIHGVGQFEPGEAHEAAYAAVDDLRRAGMHTGNDDAALGRMDRWAREFARQSDDWPQHVAACIRGLAQAMLEKNEDHLMRIEPADVGERAARLRTQYYDARLDATEPVPLEISTAIHAALRKRNGALSKTAALVSIDEAVRALPEPIRVELAADLSGPNAILRQLARAGVVSVSSGRRDVTSPIPSLGRHILHLADEPPSAQPVGWQPYSPN